MLIALKKPWRSTGFWSARRNVHVTFWFELRLFLWVSHGSELLHVPLITSFKERQYRQRCLPIIHLSTEDAFPEGDLDSSILDQTYINAALIGATYEMHRRDHQTIDTSAGKLNRANQLKVAQRPDLAQRGRNVERKDYQSVDAARKNQTEKWKQKMGYTQMEKGRTTRKGDQVRGGVTRKSKQTRKTCRMKILQCTKVRKRWCTKVTHV